MRLPKLRLSLLFLSLASAACTAGDVDLTGKRCPCAPSWICDEARDECVPRRPPDGGVSNDGGMDGAIVTDGGDADVDPPDADVEIDAGGSDAGPPPDGGIDAGADPTGCDDEHAAAIICDGFEELPSFARWTQARHAATTTASPVFRGSAAFAAPISSDSILAYLYLRAPTAIGSGELFARTYLFLPASSPAERMTIVHLEQSGSPYDYAELRLTDGGLTLAVKSDDVVTIAPELPMPRDRWVCLELRVAVASSGGTAEVFVDGVSARSLDGLDTLPAPGYSTFYVGISWIGMEQTRPSVLYMDEVVVDTARVGCD